MKINLKKLGIILFLSFFIKNNTTLNKNEPLVKFKGDRVIGSYYYENPNKFYPDLYETEPGTVLPKDKCYRTTEGSSLNRYLGVTFDTLINTFEINELIFKEKAIDKKYKILSFYLTDKKRLSIYIIQNNICVGYYLVDIEFNTFCYKDEPIIKKIKSLKNKNYIKVDKKNNPDIELKSFETKNKSNYKEVYTFLSDNKRQDILLLDAFYPNKLDEVLKSELRKFLIDNNIKTKIEDEDKEKEDDDGDDREKKKDKR